jgi:type I restriction enzyme S subunit
MENRVSKHSGSASPASEILWKALSICDSFKFQDRVVCNGMGYLSLALNQPKTRLWLTQHAVGAIMPNLNTGILSDVPILLPSPSILNSFETFIEILEGKISANNAIVQTLASLRDTLLPRLISGLLRLPEVEAVLEESIA